MEKIWNILLIKRKNEHLLFFGSGGCIGCWKLEANQRGFSIGASRLFSCWIYLKWQLLSQLIILKNDSNFETLKYYNENCKNIIKIL